MRLFLNKRGEGSDDIIFPTVIFIIGNILFFSILFIFIYRASSLALVYEQSYAKEIALILDKAKSGSNISIDFSKGYEISEKNGWSQNDFSKIVSIDKDKVSVSLAKGGGYAMSYFSNQVTKVTFDKIGKKVVLIIK